jgi:hypothetical protein
VEYEQFCRLAVAASRFGDWDDDGPATLKPPAGDGILHHHLVNDRNVSSVLDDFIRRQSAEFQAQNRLWRAAESIPQAFAVAVRLQREPSGGSGGYRDFALSATASTGYRFGDSISLNVTADETCHVLLLYLGMSGKSYLLVPSVLAPTMHLTSSESLTLPPAEQPMTLSGDRPGRERIVAIASRAPLPLPLLQTDRSNQVYELASSELDELTSFAESGLTEGACARVDFLVRP